MPEIQYRVANESDILSIARLRWAISGREEYWNNRISRYFHGENNPQEALKPRIIYVALDSADTVGFIAGHLTLRYACEGELQWINVAPEYRGKGIALELLRLIAGWFVEQKSLEICVDVDPDNATASNFYKRHGAENLNKHWLVWKDISVVLAK